MFQGLEARLHIDMFCTDMHGRHMNEYDIKTALETKRDQKLDG